MKNSILSYSKIYEFLTMPGYDDGNYISQNNQHHNKIRSTATKTTKSPETNKMLALELMKFSYGAEKKIRQ